MVNIKYQYFRGTITAAFFISIKLAAKIGAMNIEECRWKDPVGGRRGGGGGTVENMEQMYAII